MHIRSRIQVLKKEKLRKILKITLSPYRHELKLIHDIKSRLPKAIIAIKGALF
jgi:hypothetical protein